MGASWGGPGAMGQSRESLRSQEASGNAGGGVFPEERQGLGKALLPMRASQESNSEAIAGTNEIYC